MKVDQNGFNFDQGRKELEHANSNELKESFRQLFLELFSILSDLTADVITAGIDEAGDEGFDEKVMVEPDEKACARLGILYEISRTFAAFDSVEKTFPEIFLSLNSLYSFKSIVLLEKRPFAAETTLWFDPGATEEGKEHALWHARALYDYLVCPLGEECPVDPLRKEVPLNICCLDLERGAHSAHRFITLPLSLSSLEPFGILQFECLEEMKECDLLFINALSNFIAVTLDRYNREQAAEYQHQCEINKREKELVDVHQYAISLEKERELREQFVATLTHDLRTPLTAAKMGAQLILRHPDNPEKNQQLAAKIIRSIDRMDQMIRDLLDASRIRAGESLSMVMNECDLREVALMTLRELGVAYGDRFVLETESDSITGHWNEDGLRRVIENLANNAVKYGFPQQQVTVSLKQTNDTAQIIVHNYGPPIPAEEQHLLFKPFQHARSAQTGLKKGWGLGLTLVKGVVEAHGGEVSVLSSEGEGTTFIVTLPKDSRPYQTLQ